MGQGTMTKLMKNDPQKYPTENDAVDDALIQASGKKVSYSDINKYKDTYDHFAWTIAMAPADNPKIAVVTLLILAGLIQVIQQCPPVSVLLYQLLNAVKLRCDLCAPYQHF